MKTISTYLFVCVSAIASVAQDTLFYKNFNDSDIYTSNTASIVSLYPPQPRIVSTPNSSLYVDLSPALAFDLTDMVGKESFYNRHFDVPFFDIALLSSPTADSIKIVFDWRSKGTKPEGNKLGDIQVSDIPVIYSYRNTATSKYYTKTYTIRFNFPIAVGLRCCARISHKETLDAINPGIRRTTTTMVEAKSSFNGWGLSLQYASSPFYLVSLDGEVKTFRLHELKSALSQDFCSGTDNLADCQSYLMTQLIDNTGDVNYDKDILIDNIAILGIKKVITGLEEETFPKQAQEVIRAFTPMGVLIEDYPNYTGLAIVEMADGSHKKQYKTH